MRIVDKSQSINHKPLAQYDDDQGSGNPEANSRAQARKSRTDVATSGAATYTQEEREMAARALENLGS